MKIESQGKGMKLTYLVLILIAVFYLNGCRENGPSDSSPNSPDPNRYHWNGITDPFFEGWFYKIHDPVSNNSFFIIYGVQNPGDEQNESSGGFIYIMRDDGDKNFTRYPHSAFTASTSRCDVTINSSRATESFISGSLLSDEELINWNLSFNILSSWPNTMGSLTDVPNLDVNWHVSGLNANVSGTIEWKGEIYTLESVPGYSDHNWGNVFPYAWIWMQAHSFQNEQNTALALAGGIATIGIIESPAFMLIYESSNGRFEFRTQDLNVNFDLELD